MTQVYAKQELFRLDPGWPRKLDTPNPAFLSKGVMVPPLRGLDTMPVNFVLLAKKEAYNSARVEGGGSNPAGCVRFGLAGLAAQTHL